MENEFDELFEADQGSLEAEFDKIRDTRLNEILKCLKSLYVIINAYKQYKHETHTDFDSMIKQVNNSLNSEEESRKLFHYFDTSYAIGSDEFNNYYRQIMTMINSPEYRPPNIAEDIYDHLLTLWFCYSSHYLRHRYLLRDLQLDLCLMKVMSRADLAFNDIINKGNRDLQRTKGSTKTQKEKAHKRREHIIQLFNYIKKKESGKKMTLRAVALAIRNDWKAFSPEDKDIKMPPGVTLISEILGNSEETNRDFERVGRLRILKM
jgi:hypothetical protein